MEDNSSGQCSSIPIKKTPRNSEPHPAAHRTPPSVRPSILPHCPCGHSRLHGTGVKERQLFSSKPRAALQPSVTLGQLSPPLSVKPCGSFPGSAPARSLPGPCSCCHCRRGPHRPQVPAASPPPVVLLPLPAWANPGSSLGCSPKAACIGCNRLLCCLS